MATALVAVACVEEPPATDVGDEQRLRTLESAFVARSSDPQEAARLFAEAGPGGWLERVRLQAWYDCLVRSAADEAGWRTFLVAGPPAELEAAARARLGRILLDSGEMQAAIEVMAGAGPAADEVLLAAADASVRLAAARRLAVAAPSRLRGASRKLEDQVVNALPPEELIARAQTWRAEGYAARAAAELGRRRFRGEAEQSRRLELARSEVEAGRPSRALRVLPSRGSAESSLVRAMAYRRQGWQRFPKGRWKASFRACLKSARRAEQEFTPLSDNHLSALRLVVECGTEAGSLEQASNAWWQLVSSGSPSSTEAWIGRRLGVALATSGGGSAQVRTMAGSIPDHERCLRYWAAAADHTPPGAELEQLADARIGDLYAVWARSDLGASQPAFQPMPPPMGKAEPPPSVRWLAERQELREASREWQRIRQMRGSTPAEGLAASLFEHSRGRPNRAIRTLRSVFPELGGVSLAEVPEDVARAYLPLLWTDELEYAAREQGLDPWLVAAVARQESLFVPHARSPRGAIGVLQLIPTTAAGHGRALGLGRRPDLTDPAVNLRLGARELAALIGDFGAVEPALAAYNAGPARARRWWRLWPERRRFTEGVPIPETYTYIRRVVFLAEAYRQVYGEQWKETP